MSSERSSRRTSRHSLCDAVSKQRRIAARLESDQRGGVTYEAPDEVVASLDQEAERVTVRLRFANQVSLLLHRCADKLAEFRDGLRMKRDALTAQLLQLLVAEDDARAVDSRREDAEFRHLWCHMSHNIPQQR